MIEINFGFNERSGQDVISIDNYYLFIENTQLINKIKFTIKYKDIVCIMGSNGSGKTTLIKKILENNNPSIKIGRSVKICYIPQEIAFEEKMESHLRSALNKFYFNGENIFKQVNKLSGGEKVRLKLFELIQKECNCIILDEPTNHIDINTKEILEEALKEYQGTLVFISHDRYFINEVANKILYIKDKRIKEYVGNYDDYKIKNTN